MDVEKIGNMIKESRKIKKLTQQDLANLLNVSDKAVSKWERGLGCPDISLLIPISDALDISLYELLNGEKMDNDDFDKKLKNSIKVYENKMRLKNKKSKKRNLFISLITIFILLIIIFKLGFLYRYKNINNYSNTYIIKDEIAVNSNYDKEFDYIQFKNIKFKNIISNFSEVEYAEKNDNLKQYTLVDDDNNIITFSVSKNELLINSLKENNVVDGFDAERFFKKNKIYNDWSLIKYLEKANTKSNFFTPIAKIKENYYVNELIEYIIGSECVFTHISGDYEGYIKDFYSMGYKEIHIIKNNKDYAFLISKKYFNDSTIIELLESLIIE